MHERTPPTECAPLDVGVEMFDHGLSLGNLPDEKLGGGGGQVLGIRGTLRLDTLQSIGKLFHLVVQLTRVLEHALPLLRGPTRSAADDTEHCMHLVLETVHCAIEEGAVERLLFELAHVVLDLLHEAQQLLHDRAAGGAVHVEPRRLFQVVAKGQALQLDSAFLHHLLIVLLPCSWSMIVGRHMPYKRNRRARAGGKLGRE
mmetsp:Transcript_18872/g.49519  ORF Transcript_18872/g.49519 Transcript_18872/m.49519 type:complete len:201 (+) Transcript_18872:257-859(+)